MTDICEQCGNEYELIAGHWSQSSECSHPSLTEHQMEVATGLLMGDGWIHDYSNRNPKIGSAMISPNYLKHIDSIFGIFGNGVSLKTTAEESARKNRESNFRPDAKAENYSDLYEWFSMRHPDFEELSSWYGEDGKVWPSDLKLTPTVLKHWYCGDGNWQNNQSKNHIRIGMSNELGNEQKVDNMFHSANLPAPSNYVTGERRDGSISMSAVFTVEQSKELWQYMGKPLPDFDYKWPEEYR